MKAWLERRGASAPELRTGGPTLEEFVDANYPASRYPPEGYAEVPSPGLKAYREQGIEPSRLRPVQGTPPMGEVAPSPPYEGRELRPAEEVFAPDSLKSDPETKVAETRPAEAKAETKIDAPKSKVEATAKTDAPKTDAVKPAAVKPTTKTSDSKTPSDKGRT